MITKVLVNLLSLALVSAKAVKNTQTAAEYDLPVFNLESGFYEESSVNLKIETSDPDAIIYYTIDGSIPNENSTVYESPITFNNKSLEENILSAYKQIEPSQNFAPIEKINKANVIRAIAKYPNKNNTFSEVVSKTYWVGMNRNSLYGDLLLISLMTDPDNLFDYEKGIYVLGKDYDDWINENPDNIKLNNYLKKANYGRKGKASEVPAFIEYFPAEKNRQGFSDNVGIRIMGAVEVTVTSKKFKKGGFTINGGSMVFNKEYKGLYFKENVLYLTATPAQGRTFKYWKIKNCKFANPNYSVNTNKSKFKKATVGIYPSKGCKVVAYFK
ncbi:hypothetical protein PIROE2DRAFT_1955 [Piromyces sp. E2]|nr:hypothetical protein PIROE2DRAFT_1955 [Piromyces sp. E2]|eukprot:OUM70010.1 hypothetical protein PIROE2DRAFT_1955 [Piromyces sp. E2]